MLPGSASTNSLGTRRAREPVRVGLDVGDHVGGFPVDGQLPRPRQRRPAVLARPEEGAPVLRQLLVGQRAQDRARQHGFHEQIALEDQLLALRRPERLEDAARGVGPLVPGQRRTMASM
jgi:hypothetical protein